ncbi:DMT family transporter [Noviherbaspirillum galbum]|uniref:DMT family transporter n=1 Tax=Noviherbaspirillum galbum TaxID=2709383 RepID=A0A6B3SQ94_9BURK|nr:DMT family transporter [Noviherbaspirillum galbum]NEX62927.1 DMT family transporter [Noviherbaspirillum galbum]
MKMNRRPLDATAMLTLLVLCILWGLQQVAVKAVAPSVSPTLQLGLRSLVAAALVYGLILVRGPRLALRDGTLLPGLGAGLLFAIEFLFAAVGLQYTTASHMSVFLYTAPIFTVLGLQLMVPGERLSPRQWAGVLAAFAGVAVAFSNGFSSSEKSMTDMLLGDALGVLGGLFWAATTVLIRCSALSEAPPATTLFYQLAGCGVLLSAIAVGSGQHHGMQLTPLAWGSLFFQSVIVAFASYLAWFWLLRRYLASRVTVFSFLTPMFGVGFGVLILHDPVDIRFGIGALMVLAGVVLVNLRRPAS